MNLQYFGVKSLLILEFIFKGCAETLNSGSHWVKRHGGLCPTTSHEGVEMSFYQCLVWCSLNSTCKAFFYTSDLRQCRLRDSIVLRSIHLPLQDSNSTVYFEREDATPTYSELSVPEFLTVLVAFNDVLKFRIFFGEAVSQSIGVQRCSSLGGHLVRVFTHARHAFFEKLTEAMIGRGPYWTDVTNKYAADYSDINEWTTEDGQSIPITFWMPGQPEQPGSLHCGILSTPYQNNWKSYNCFVSGIWTCEL